MVHIILSVICLNVFTYLQLTLMVYVWQRDLHVDSGQVVCDLKHNQFFLTQFQF